MQRDFNQFEKRFTLCKGFRLIIDAEEWEI